MITPWKLLILAVAVFIVWKLFSGDRRQKQLKKDKERETVVASGEMVKDPICGTYVRKDGDIRVRQGEQVFTFCSYDCREKYLQQITGGEGKDEGKDA